MSEYRLGYQVRITSAKSYTFGVNWAYLFIASSFGKQFSGTGCDSATTFIPCWHGLTTLLSCGVRSTKKRRPEDG